MRRAPPAASLSLALCVAVAAQAAPPTSTYALEIGDANEIWYPEGDAEFCDSGDNEGICALATGAAVDSLGQVSAAGEIRIHLPDSLDADLPMTVAGASAGTTSKPTPKVEIAAEGLATLREPTGAVVMHSTARGKLACRNPLPHQPDFACRGRVRFCFDTLAFHDCFAARIEVHLGAGGGRWTLRLDLATDGAGAVTGEASATLANGASETFVAMRDRTKLRFASRTPLSKDGLTLDRRRDLYGVTQQKVKFKIAGQAGEFTLLGFP